MSDSATAKDTRSTCPYCGVGCGVIIESRGDQITGVRGDPEHPANFGRLCSKGSTLHLTATAPVTLQTRLLHPQRRSARGGPLQQVDWDDAFAQATDRFADVIEKHGPDAVAFYVSGQLLTEDYYVFNKLAKGLVGTNNIDTNSRLCMSSAVAGYKQTLGADAPPCSYEDIAHASTLFITGSNTVFAHPVLFRRIEDARRANPELKIIVADPRRTETADAADLFLQILPGTDVALYNGMLHVMLWEGLLDRPFIAAHTSGFEALKARVRDFTPKDVARRCGITEDALVQAAQWFGRQGGATLSLYCQGLNQSSSGTAKNAALIHLHLATGQIGKPGAGPFSLTGQPNAMGGREVGGMANLLSAHRDLGNAEHRAEVAALWGVDEVPAQPGLTAVELFEAMDKGRIKAVWIACTNPAQSMPDQALVRRALERAEFVVVQEAFSTTATCRYADLLLPASTWGEKDGTVTNSERRISRVRAAVPPAGSARHDWLIALQFAQRLEARLRPGRRTLFPYADAQSVWEEHRATTQGRDLDITGMSYAMLESRGPQQWPFPEGAAGGTVRLYEDGVFATPDGRARFVDAPDRPLAEPRDARFPFSLTTGRLRDQWHGMSRTGTLGRLFGHAAEPAVQMSRQDVGRLGLADGDLVRVTSRRGSLLLPVQASEQVAPAQAFIAMHWGDEFLGGGANGEGGSGVNGLMLSAFDPQSMQPELKHAAVKVVKVDKAELPWSLLAVAWMDDDRALAARQALQALMPSFAFATVVPFGHARSGVLFRAAAKASPGASVLLQIEALLGLQGPDVLRYADQRAGQQRSMRLAMDTQGHQRLQAFMLAGDVSAEAWLKTLLQEELPAETYGRLLLMPSAKAPLALKAKGKQVCTCFNIHQPEIEAVLREVCGDHDTTPEQALAQLQAALRCGTQCGSCVPELKKLVLMSHAHA
jgi:assimilatory nitrate reductase catalytic subunit